MVSSVSRIFRLLAIIVIIASLGTMGLATMQNAWAMPGPTCLLTKTQVLVGGFNLWTCWGVAGLNPHTGGVIFIFRVIDDTGVADTSVTFAAGPTCVIPPVLGTGGADGLTDAFLLENGAGAPSLYSIPDPTAGPSVPAVAGAEDSITVKYPPGPITATTSDGNGNGAPVFTGAPVWVQKGTGGAVPALSLGTWQFTTCVVDTQIGAAGFDSDPFAVKKLVGGEILPINTTSLLIAGIFTNSYWTLLVLGAVAAGSFVILRHQLKIKK